MVRSTQAWRCITAPLIAALLTVIAFGVGASPAHSDVPLISRATKDRPDQIGEWQIHVIYFVPKGTADARLDINGTLDAAARRMQTWFRSASGGYSWRLDTFGPDRRLDVTFVRGRKTNDAYTSGSTSVLSEVGEELRRMGMRVAKTKKRYLIFYAGDTSESELCGAAEYPIYAPRQYTPARDPGVLLGGDFAIVFLGAPAGCHPNDFGRGNTPGWVQSSMMHELIHTEGLTPPGALHTCEPTFLISAGHVCGFGPASLAAPTVTEPVDPERGDLMFPFINMALSEKVLDAGRDDYFDTSVGTLDLIDSAFIDGPGPASGRLLGRGIVWPRTIEIHGDRFAEVTLDDHHSHTH